MCAKVWAVIEVEVEDGQLIVGSALTTPAPPTVRGRVE
jgi:hypothetical protein